MPDYVISDIEVARTAQGDLKNLGKTVEDKDFWGLVKALPSMIVQEGVLQTLAFLKGKKEGKYHKIFNAINGFSKNKLGVNDNNFNLIEYLLDHSIKLEQYIYLEEQILQYVIWYKRIGLALYAPEECK